MLGKSEQELSWGQSMCQDGGSWPGQTDVGDGERPDRTQLASARALLSSSVPACLCLMWQLSQ